MKTAFLAALAAVAAKLVDAHYTFPDLIIGGVVSSDWEYVRLADNHYSNAPVTDVTSAEFQCYQTAATAAAAGATVTVAAGSTIGWQANGAIYHPGNLAVYMSAAVPSASSLSAGTGTTWFKVYNDAPVYTGGALVFPSQSMQSFTFTLPASLPSGDYLVRVEQAALHVASTFGGAQFYLACGQITVTGGGSGTPGPLVAFPGAYTGYEPGILIDIYNLPANYPGYTVPGPAVWPPAGGGSPPPPPPSSTTHAPSSTPKPSSSSTTTKAPTSSAKSTSTTSAKTTSTTAPGGGGGAPVAEYGQCGGSGYTGSTTCVAGTTCTALNTYYSQCLA